MHYYQTASTTRPTFAIVFLLALLAAGCDKLGLTRITLPDMGPQIPVSVTLSFDPSLTSAKSTYTDSCGHPDVPVLLGQVLESALTDAADQTFKAVRLADKQSGEAKSDVTVQVSLRQMGFKIYPDAMYDRVPAEIQLEAVAVFRDSSGKVIGEFPLKVTHRTRLAVVMLQKRCEYVMDPFVQDAAVSLATLFARASRDLLDPNSQSALVFKTTVLDESGNALLEGGERIKIRVDLTNSGKTPITGIAVALSGTPTFVAYFPVQTLAMDALQPGESRSVEFAATLPQSVEAQRAEAIVSVRVVSGASAPASQTVAATLKGGRFDSVDQVPANTGLQHPHTYVLAVGISTYRDPQIAARKYASLDAELISTYFQTVGGVPAANVRLLQDWKVLRSDIEDFILEWLPRRMNSDSVVIVYFSGQAAVSPSGETYLIPYDGKHNSTARLYPLKDLETGLARLKTKQTLFIFDGGMLSIGPAGSVKRRGPQWGSSKSPVLHLIGTTGFRNGLEPVKLRHGLFTYYVLRGLKGEADANVDGDVTLGELTAFVGKTVSAAAKQDFNQEQQPLFIPPILPTSKSAGLLLTKSASR